MKPITAIAKGKQKDKWTIKGIKVAITKIYYLWKRIVKRIRRLILYNLSGYGKIKLEK